MEYSRELNRFIPTASRTSDIFLSFVFSFLPLFFSVYGTVQYIKLTMSAFQHTINIACHIINSRGTYNNIDHTLPLLWGVVKRPSP